MSAIRPGTILDGRFQLLHEIGKGGMGVVYSAMHLSINKEVAIKILRPDVSGDPRKLQRFQREAQAIALLDHPNIVHVFSVGMAQPGQPYIAMELLRGEQLSKQINERGFLPWKEALPIFIQICDALQHAHDQKVIHRDVNPNNIVCGFSDDGKPYAKLLDFGIAKFLGDRSTRITQTDAVVGTVSYTSPAQFAGQEADESSDLYSLGCTIYQTLSGKLPCAGENTFETINNHLLVEPDPINVANPSSAVPEDLDYLVGRMLNKDSGQRPQSVTEVRDQLSKILECQKIPRSGQVRYRLRKLIKNAGKVRVGVLILAPLVILAAGILFVVSSPKPAAVVPTSTDLTENPAEQRLLHRLKDTDKKSYGYARNIFDLANVYDPNKQPPDSALRTSTNLFDVRAQILYERAYQLAMKLKNSRLALEIEYDLAQSYARTGRLEDAIRLEQQWMPAAESRSYTTFPRRLMLMCHLTKNGQYKAADAWTDKVISTIEFAKKELHEVQNGYAAAIVVKTALGEKQLAREYEQEYDAMVAGHPPLDLREAKAYSLETTEPIAAAALYSQLADDLSNRQHQDDYAAVNDGRTLKRVLGRWLTIAPEKDREEVAHRLKDASTQFSEVFRRLNDRSRLTLPDF